MIRTPEIGDVNLKYSDLSHILKEMEDESSDSRKAQPQSYTSIITSLQLSATLDSETTKRILAICMKDLTNNLQFSLNAFNVISIILKKIKEGKCDYSSAQLLNSALTTLNAAIKLLNKTSNKICFETLLSYPDETLIALVSSRRDTFIELIDYHPKHRLHSEITKWISQIIIKLLQILPPEEKMLFVRSGVDAWFNTLIPGIMSVDILDPGFDHNVLALQLITEYLKQVDYADNVAWQLILENICSAKRYPAVLRAALQSGSEHWHILWKVFITLLKDQITKVNKSSVSPINAMLPVVELAFKLDATTRCKAFDCWNVLIDNLSAELNEALVNKRLKLLMIPLTLNNAKVEETVLAKLNTWWHLIRQFYTKLDKFTDFVLVPFLHFCFGKPSDNPKKPIANSGQMTNTLSLKCIEVLVQIVGHVDCDGCCTLPGINGRLISTKLLADQWSLWMHCLCTVIKTAVENYSETVLKQIKCLWKGFVMIIAELPDNQIRADLFMELLKCMEILLVLCKSGDRTADIIFDVLIGSLLVDNPKIRPLLKTKNGLGPMQIILRIIQNSAMNKCFSRPDVTLEEKVNKLKPVASVIMDSSLMDSDHLLQCWASSENRLVPWAALVDTVCDSQCDVKRLNQTVSNLVLWPTRTVSSTVIPEYSDAICYRWYKLYNYVHPLINTLLLDQELEKILSGKSAFKITNSQFRLCAAIALVKQKLIGDKNSNIEVAIQVLSDALKTMADANDHKQHLIDEWFPILTDTLDLLLNKVARTDSVDLAQTAIMIVQNTFKIIKVILSKNCGKQKPIYIDNLRDSSERFLNKLSKNDAYASLKPEIAIAYKKKAEIDHTLSNKSTISKANANITETEPIDIETTEQKSDSGKIDFTTPEPKSTQKKKTNKKELNIVNTVVENGEEFVVVKSHWKFNPKKLTENQKEKFKRKREDIPALYQDLSQSQDEFKLKSWKTDSQDATTSKSESNSKSADDVAGILQKMTSTEVVPKIIENIFSESASNKNENSADTTEKHSDNNNKLQKTPTVKGPKTPRLALKDRVFKNVRNLIEKSGVQGEGNATNQVVEEMNQTVNENALKTPVSIAKIVQNTANSAPPKISTARPTRSIKKPKKFEDTEIFALKRKRRSHSDTQQDEKNSDQGEETPMDSVIITKEVDDKKEQENTNNLTEPAKESQSAEDPKPSDVDVVSQKAPSPQIESSDVVQINDQDKIRSDQYLSVCSSEFGDNKQIEIEECSTQENILQEQPINDSQVIEEISTPRPEKSKKKDDDPSSIKKKRSRIEKQLLIDMVEGHPVLQQSQSEKRVTRKNITETNDTVSKRRKSLIEKSNKIKAELVGAKIVDAQIKEKNKQNSKSPSPKNETQKTQKVAAAEQEAKLAQTVTILSQELSGESQEDMPMSEDIIESSQDSTLTTISVKSSIKKKVPVVCLNKRNPLCENSSDTQKLIDDFNVEVIPLSDTLNDISGLAEKDDIELPKNKTMPEENAIDLTENMDTEPLDSSGEVVIINDDEVTPIVINTEDTAAGKETQELAEADTLPMDVESQSIPSTLDKNSNNTATIVTLEVKPTQSDNDITNVPSQKVVTPTLTGTVEVVTDIIVESSNTDSPLKDEIQRKKEFLNDTIEISPIKPLSPVRENKSPSPETSSEYVVIKLTSPVQSNGEPYNEKCDSPEVFTEDKVSPDKRDQSPPRKEVITTNSSPSSSLSLKKNKPQMRFNGRAAQMLGLCVPENLQILNTERSDNDEGRRSSPVSTPARRNLKKFYTASGENNENLANDNETNESENFLKFTRPLPTAESSPCNPILKRKLAEIADDSTVSPASKRKRVSFHDPPVSTTVAVQKYIEPCGVRSPSNSAIKRQERQLRALTNAKSPKRLENVFRLETVLTKAVESFSYESTANSSNETQMSLDETPAVEVVKTSELNNTDPIFPELLDCKDPIENIAAELSSPSTKTLLVKELQGKVETIADLAKMTELEVNRLCIKAPKVKVAKKALSKYASERAKSQEILPVTPVVEVPTVVVEVEKVNAEVQTNEVVTKNSEMQTMDVPKLFTCISIQTDAVPVTHCSSQTTESGRKSTKDVIATCLSERPDFVDQLTTQLQQSSIRQISEQLPFSRVLSLLMEKITDSNSSEALNQVLLQTSDFTTKGSKGIDLKILQEHLCKRFDSKDLILFCSQLLKKAHDDMH